MVTVEQEERVPHFDFAHSALLLDIDGTLLDIAPTPDAVTVPDNLVANIAAISARTTGAVAFVSGRRIPVIDGLFRPLKLPAVGCHGAEFRAPGGETDEAAAIPGRIREQISKIALLAPGIRIEDKEHTLAIHFRGVPEIEPAIHRALEGQQSALAAEKLQVMSGKAVIEIKPGWFNKGTGISRLMRLAPFLGRIPMFLGDDTTDEDVFKVLPQFGGVGCAVGRRIAGASHTFRAPADVRRWLDSLANS